MNISDQDLIASLRRMVPETGSRICLGCGYEHNCSIHGCAVLRAAVERLELAAPARDYAVRQLGAVSLQAERDRQARAEQAAAYKAMGTYQYIGECVITAYCPCEECCGQWADGLTATGIPAGPGIVAVDPDVIPLGSTVIINGCRYLAADTGVTGNAVDICAAGHEEAVEFGVRTAEVWVIAS